MAVAPVDIGLETDARAQIAEALGGLLANSYGLFLKTQNYHWNVTGPHFQQLHALFEELYTELFEANDDVAERIRALGHEAPGSFKTYLEDLKISEAGSNLSSVAMVNELMADNEALSRLATEVSNVAADAGDKATEDMMIERITAHDKAAWMLRSSLGNI